MKKNNKIVYVLGAGFSKAFGYPLQSEILPKLFENSTENDRIELVGFISENFLGKDQVPLEDIYTILEKSIKEGKRIGSKGPNELRDLKIQLDRSIAKIFSADISKEDEKLLINFAKVLVNIRETRGQKDDTISIISTNWDFLLEESLLRLPKPTKKKQKGEKGVAVDYCTYDQQLDPRLKKRIPNSIYLKSRGFYNIKLLKLHGSISWVKCPGCDSLFVAFKMQLVKSLRTKKYDCFLCERNLGTRSKLDLFQISPTFEKDLTNVHYRMIWWNAGFEIAEATHIVFIGYSLPLADYEFRNLLIKNLPTTRRPHIKVVLYIKKNCKKSTFNYEEEKSRYKSFFGNILTDHDFSSLGAKNYIERLAERGRKSVWKFHEEPWKWVK